MTDLARIERTMSRVRAALSEMTSTDLPHRQQVSWEEFLLSWRTAINQISDLLRRSGYPHLASENQQARMADPLLDYTWEARNVEEHSSEGSSDPALRMIVSTATFGGAPLVLNGVNIRVGRNVQVLKFRDLAVKRRGQIITLAAPESGPGSLAAHAFAHLELYRTLMLQTLRP